MRSYSRHSRATRWESEIATSSSSSSEDLLGAQLVRRVEVREEEADGHGAEALVLHATRRLADRVLVQRLELLAGVVQPAADLHDVAARNERGGLAVVDVVQARAVAARDVVDVARARGGQEQDLLAAALEKGVQSLRRAVHREADLGGRWDDRVERREDALGEVARSRRGFPRGVRPGLLVVGDDVGEGPADVHGDAVAGQLGGAAVVGWPSPAVRTTV